MIRSVVAWTSALLASVVAGCVIGFVAFRPDLAEPHIILLSALTFSLLVAIVIRVRPRKIGPDRPLT